MPYKISNQGLELVKHNQKLEPSTTPGYSTSQSVLDALKFRLLTNLQKEVLSYLASRYEEGETDFIETHDIAYDLKLHPRATSGIAYSLYKKGLVEKGD